MMNKFMKRTIVTGMAASMVLSAAMISNAATIIKVKDSVVYEDSNGQKVSEKSTYSDYTFNLGFYFNGDYSNEWSNYKLKLPSNASVKNGIVIDNTGYDFEAQIGDEGTVLEIYYNDTTLTADEYAASKVSKSSVTFANGAKVEDVTIGGYTYKHIKATKRAPFGNVVEESYFRTIGDKVMTIHAMYAESDATVPNIIASITPVAEVK